MSHYTWWAPLSTNTTNMDCPESCQESKLWHQYSTGLVKASRGHWWKHPYIISVSKFKREDRFWVPRFSMFSKCPHQTVDDWNNLVTSDIRGISAKLVVICVHGNSIYIKKCICMLTHLILYIVYQNVYRCMLSYTNQFSLQMLTPD